MTHTVYNGLRNLNLSPVSLLSFNSTHIQGRSQGFQSGRLLKRPYRLRADGWDPKGRKRWWDFWGGAVSPSPPARGPGERCELPSGVRGGAPAAQRFFYILSALDGFSWPSQNAGVPPPLLKEEISHRICANLTSRLWDVWGVELPQTSPWLRAWM